MVRLLLWVILIAVAVYYFKRLGKHSAARKSPAPPEGVAAPMVRCDHCGVHLPRDRALSQQNQWYCSQAHLEQGQGSRDR
ncbi:PP0621 family protein [Pseudomonas sp. 10B1]|uniref:PP0621 family protein n=1 Tax=unclassified Pseudomonas TaxID=196821 RepID=UPI002AB54270|nr:MULTISPECIES: PP0621 family protein [unclassified Pseudomonas]MDY7561908.1 PP0621 family protein [Pseudomonas sp. AB6]MEA9976064.1 PP0621 family protein [Pseudomonas sp. RTS4]MEA9993430.1 PP0621 family protein [Pseudomonas sp. AA4]MEB0088950.1 PP0621 family protein [Pseudomonas sp. RTI1]MEB0126297.1 PP0621 family protein [Pseudomonas sp. CCC1.2]